MKKFGEILIEEGHATFIQVKEALAYQMTVKISLGEAMIQLGFITEKIRDMMVQLQMHELRDSNSMG